MSIEGLDGYDRLKDVDVWRKAQQMVSGGMREEEEAGESEEQKEDLDVSLDQEIESKPEGWSISSSVGKKMCVGDGLQSLQCVWENF